MGVVIKALDAGQRAAWEPLWQGYLAFYKASIGPVVTDLTFARLSTKGGVMGGFLAWDDERAVGMVNWIRHPSCWTAGDYCYLQDLFVDPAARGLGAGRALIEAVYAAADANGTPAVYWLTQDFNETARLLYDRVAQVTPFIRYNRKL